MRGERWLQQFAFEALGLEGANLLELLVDRGIDTGNEEGCDGSHLGQILAIGVGLNHAFDESIDDLLVALEREDQRDVDGDALSRVAVIAGRPSRVAGILIMAFGRSTLAQSSSACFSVSAVSCARRGSTSMETRPLT